MSCQSLCFFLFPLSANPPCDDYNLNAQEKAALFQVLCINFAKALHGILKEKLRRRTGQFQSNLCILINTLPMLCISTKYFGRNSFSFKAQTEVKLHAIEDSGKVLNELVPPFEYSKVPLIGITGKS